MKSEISEKSFFFKGEAPAITRSLVARFPARMQ